ncbi:MAG: transporter substrate-binding protein, partial [Desulfobulbaceae bacterium]|nr:transporter substrate-binding protein [Desulfobulbaceae bacterium]
YLVGSYYVFPRIANQLINDLANLLGGVVVKERYRPLGSVDFSAIAQEIAVLKPAVVFNTLNGDSNNAFFAALHKFGVKGADIPVFSFSITETELQVMAKELPAGTMTGHYASWSYFESLPGEENKQFLQRYRARYGSDRIVNDPMVAAYTGVYLWAQSVEDVKGLDPQKVRRAFSRQSLSGPGGIVYVDDKNHHVWKPDRIGKANSDGRFEIVWDSRTPIRPEPYPSYSEKIYWQKLENQLYRQWDKQWGAVPEAQP